MTCAPGSNEPSGFILTTILGIVMAYRFTPSPALVTVCLLLGVAIPVLMLLLRT